MTGFFEDLFLVMAGQVSGFKQEAKTAFFQAACLMCIRAFFLWL